MSGLCCSPQCIRTIHTYIHTYVHNYKKYFYIQKHITKQGKNILTSILLTNNCGFFETSKLVPEKVKIVPPL